MTKRNELMKNIAVVLIVLFALTLVPIQNVRASTKPLTEVNAFVMAESINYSMRTERLLRVLQPDMVERYYDDWSTTEFSVEPNFPMWNLYGGPLKNDFNTIIGSVICGPSYASTLIAGPLRDLIAQVGEPNIPSLYLPPYDPTTASLYGSLGLGDPNKYAYARMLDFVYDPDPNTNYAFKQQIWHSQRLIDAGVEAINFDSWDAGMDPNYLRDPNHLTPLDPNTFYYNSERAFFTLKSKVKAYAASQGKTVYLSTYASTLNSHPRYSYTYGGFAQDSYYYAMPQMCGVFEGEGFYGFLDGSLNAVDGVGFPGYEQEGGRILSEEATDPNTGIIMPIFGMNDGEAGFYYPHDKSQMADWTRIVYSQDLASGHIPGLFRCMQTTTEALQNETFSALANYLKFCKQNYELLHGLSLMADPGAQIWDYSYNQIVDPNVIISCFKQPGQSNREIVHVVNKQWNRAKREMTPQSLILVYPMSAAPSRVWTTTPDLLSTERTNVFTQNTSWAPGTWQYDTESGCAFICLYDLNIHQVVVFEKSGDQFNPRTDLGGLEIKFPFPGEVPTELPINNKLKVTAVQTEGKTDKFYWSVGDPNGVFYPGGNSTWGTIDQNGIYTAPNQVPGGPSQEIYIWAQSKDDLNYMGNGFPITLVSNYSTWTYDFNSDPASASPSKWGIVNGEGSWMVKDLGGGNKVLSKPNPADGGVIESYKDWCYTPIIVGGDQTWTDYKYSVDVKKDPSWTGAGNFGLIFRYQDENNFYYYDLVEDSVGGNYVTATLYKMCDGNINKVGKSRVAVTPLSTGSYTNIHVKAYNAADAVRMEVRWGTTLLRSDSDKSSTRLTKGEIGIAEAGGCAYFDNVQLQSQGSFSTTNAYVYDKIDDCNAVPGIVSSGRNNISADANSPGYYGNDSYRYKVTTNDPNNNDNTYVEYKVDPNFMSTEDIYSLNIDCYYDKNKTKIIPFHIKISNDGNNWRTISEDETFGTLYRAKYTDTFFDDDTYDPNYKTSYRVKEHRTECIPNYREDDPATTGVDETLKTRYVRIYWPEVQNAQLGKVAVFIRRE